MIKNIVFDLDETLYNDQDVKAQADVDVLTFLSNNLKNIDVKKHYKLYKESDKDLVTDWFENFLLNFTKDKVLITNLTQEAESIYWKSLSKIEPYPDAILFLNEVVNKFKLGILSDGSRKKQLNKLKFLSLTNFFEPSNLVFSEDVGVKKPYKQMFTTIIKNMNIEPKETLFIGDRLDRDIIGGNKIGFQTVLLRRNRSYNVKIKKKIEEPRYEINTFFELFSIINS